MRMANKSKHTFKKREREKSLLMKKMQKEAKKLENKRLKNEAEPYSGDGDPDIAGIIPGPQPHIEN